MPSKYDEQTRAKAVRLVTEHVDDYDSEWAAIKAVSARLGMTAETLRRWVRQAQIDTCRADGVSSESAREIWKLAQATVWIARSDAHFAGAANTSPRSLPTLSRICLASSSAASCRSEGLG